jgi:hypothetical protein
VLKRYLITCAAALLAAGVAVGAAQTQQANPASGSKESSTAPGAAAVGTTAHFEACLYRQQPGSGDYALAEINVIAQAPGQQDPAEKYALQSADTERVQSLLGKRVAVTGRVTSKPGALPTFEVTSIREIVGLCSGPAA